ncbi:unnamed protein product, partial [Polarella glacialis]
AFACDFATAEEVLCALSAADQDETVEMNLEGCGALLRGFFTFYASDFDWQSEVVSVRLGVRGKLSEDPTETRTSYCSGLPPKRFPFAESFGGYLHIEDPIEVGRNLNFALSEGTVTTMRWALDEAHSNFLQGSDLQSCLRLGELPQDPNPGDQIPLADEGGLPLPVDPAKSLMCECASCGSRLSFGEMLEHEPWPGAEQVTLVVVVGVV